MSVTLSPLTQVYQESVFELILDNARWLQSRGIDQWPLSWIEKQKSSVFTSVKQGNYWGVHKDDKLALAMQVTSAHEAIWDFEPSTAWFVHKLVIDRQYAGLGYGRQALKVVEQMAAEQGIPRLRLDCVAHNPRLRDFYLSCGFSFRRLVNIGDIDLALFEKSVRQQNSDWAC